MTEHIVAVFETEGAATAAADQLRAEGIPASAIRHYTEAETDAATTAGTTTTTTERRSGGFWAWLLGEEPAAETTRAAYPATNAYDRLRSGNTVLSVTLTDDSLIHQTIATLEAHEPLDIDERTEELDDATVTPIAPGTGVSPAGSDFDSTGAARPTGTRAGTSAGTLPPDAPGSAASGIGSTSTLGTPVGAGTAGSVPPRPIPRREGAAAAAREEVIPLSEEQLTVGKRTVDRGVTRVRRYVVERPVEQQVTLRGERVTIERRRPVEMAGNTPDATAFEERVVEVHETEEQPVVEKSARVVEEVAIRREATERTETIRDTVRKDEIDMPDGSSRSDTPTR